MFPTLLALTLGQFTEPCPDPVLHDLRLAVGLTKVLPTATSARVDDSAVAEVRVVQRQWLITGGSPGMTTLHLGGADGGEQALRVVVPVPQTDLDLIVAPVRRLFPCGSTVKARLVDTAVHLGGEASSLAEWRALFEAKRAFAGLVLEATLAPAVIEQAFADANRALRLAGLPGRFTHVGEAVVEEAVGTSALEADWRERLELAVRPCR